MNLINSNLKQTFFPFISICILFLFFCTTCNSKKKADEFQFCDNFDSQLSCTEPKTEFDTVYLDRSTFKKENPTWEDFCNFLYFTARETPGFQIKFSEPLRSEDRAKFKGKYEAKLSWKNSTEEMEGFGINESAVVSFHYLGTLMKEEFRKQKRDKEKLDLESLGIMELVYVYKLPNQPPSERVRKIHLVWK